MRKYRMLRERLSGEARIDLHPAPLASLDVVEWSCQIAPAMKNTWRG